MTGTEIIVSKRKLTYELKSSVRARDNNRCRVEDCPSWVEDRPELNVHHVLPEKYGGSDEPSNLIALCLSHHKMMHIDFHAYYPDSQRAVLKMWVYVKRLTSKVESQVKYGKFYDYKAPLEYLTGSRKFRSGQGEVFKAIMQGRDVLFVAPTGIGKSVTYQLPGLMNSKPTLVISPLKSLMKDQVRGLWKRYVPSTYINSDVGEKDMANRLVMITERLMKFVYVAPERYFKSPKSRKIFNIDYGLLVIDEAHCIDKWGLHFRESYGQLGVLRQAIGSPQTIAVTASASSETQEEIIKSLGLVDPVKIVKGFYRSNIEIILPDKYKSKVLQLKTMLREYFPDKGKALFFVASVREGESLKQHLSKLGRQAEFYHGQLKPDEKLKIQDRFTGVWAGNGCDILIATSAFGMGIDIPDIRLVVHWNIPGSIEDYYQQIGRAGRDGNRSTAVLLYQRGDEQLASYINDVGIDNARNLSPESKAVAKQGSAQEVKKMVQMMQSDSPWGYILQHFGDQAEISFIIVMWNRLQNIFKRLTFK